MKIDIGILEADRKQTAGHLERLLADTYALYLKTQFYHWNVYGPLFNTLHTMFEQQYTELAGAVDEIAERIRSLGEYAPGTFGVFRELSAVEESVDVPRAEEMIRRLVRAHETVARTAREAIEAPAPSADEATRDLLTRRLQMHEKTAWMLRSMVAEEAAGARARPVDLAAHRRTGTDPLG